MSKKIDQKEYLKKYLSGDKEVKKKKKDKKHKKSSSATVKIIDDDFVEKTDSRIDEELLLTGEDAPQIVGAYVEELANGQKWRSIVVKDEPDDGDQANTQFKQEDDDLWGKKASTAVRVKDESKAGNAIKIKREKRGSSAENSDQSPQRRRGQSSVQRRRSRTPDQSPPRRHPDSNQLQSRKRSATPDQSPPRRRESDQSRQRKRDQKSTHSKRTRTPDQSPPRRRHADQLPSRSRSRTPDQSPPRRRGHDQSPPRRGGYRPPHKGRSYTPEQTPPRRRGAHQFPSQRRSRTPDLPPAQRKRSHTPDQSPPRRQGPSLKRRSGTPDQSPPRRRPPDRSPPRKYGHRRSGTPDYPPPQQRNGKHSPPRRRGDSPPRQQNYIKQEKHSESQSPPPSHKTDSGMGKPSRKSRWEPVATRTPSPPPTHKPKETKTLDGKTAGLQNAQALKAETEERRRREDRMYAEMSTELSGRDAEVQVRNTRRMGRRAREAADEDPEKKRRREERELQKEQLYDRWGKGLKQIADHENRRAEQDYESSKPLARAKDDEDLEQHLRQQERADDPMLQYMREKKQQERKAIGLPTLPEYQGSYPENRFGIRPGYRWDGVDRSNGYEKKWFDVQNEKRALQDDAYKYSVEDM